MPTENETAGLRAELAELRRRLDAVEDLNAVRTLHFKYGYYMDRRLFEDVVSLFSEDCELHFMGGVFLGKAGARRLYCGRLGSFGERPGFLIDHLMMQDIVDIGPDRMSAQGRFRCLVQGGPHASLTDLAPARRRQYWHSGIYENDYVKRAGGWQVKVFRYSAVWEADYEEGWAKADPGRASLTPLSRTYPEDPHGPDLLERMPPVFPANQTVPFHYPNPVTGARHKDGSSA